MKALWITSHKDTINSIRPEAETLLGLARAGVELEIMTQGTSPYREAMAVAGITLIDLAPKKRLDLGIARRIREHLETGGHDILHLFNNRAITTGLYAARGLPVKVITYRGQTGNMHRLDPTCWLTHLNPGVDRIVCVADAVRDDLRPHLTHPERAVTIYKGHALEWYRDSPVDRASLGVPDDAFVVVSVANYRPRKGIEVLIEATRHLPADAPIHILLVGSDMDNEGLAMQIAASPYSDRLHVLGFRKDACAITAACDAAVLAATKREGLPKTVIEAMVYGVPPIVTDTGGSAELVESGQSGLVVAPGDPVGLAGAISQLYNNREAARTMGRQARCRIDERFNIRDTITQTLALYEEATAAS